MSHAKNFPSIFYLPNLESTEPQDVLRWAAELKTALDAFMLEVSQGMTSIVIEGTTAEKPVAEGSSSFYWDTTLGRLEYDDGTWQIV